MKTEDPWVLYILTIVYVRVYSGSITPKSVLLNTTLGVKERVGKVLEMYADQVEETNSVEVDFFFYK